MDTVSTQHFTSIVTVYQILIILFYAFVWLLNATSGRGIITCYRQTNHRTVGQINRTLNQAFTKATATDYNSTIPVLQSTCNNLTCRSRKLVNQYNQAAIQKIAISFSIKLCTRISTSLCVYNQLFLAQELIS